MSWFIRRQLRSKSGRIRRQAVHSLRGMPAETVVPLIEALLTSEDQREVVIAAVEVLSGCAGTSAPKLLLGLVGTPDSDVQLAVVEAVGRRGDPALASGLTPLMASPEPVVRGRTVQVLKQLGWHPKTREEEAAFWVASGDIRRAAFLGAAAVGPLTSVLGDTAFQRRVQAINRLADIGDSSAVKPLILALQDKDDVVRVAAADALGRLGDARAKGPLLPLLKSRNSGVRTAAAAALGAFEDASVVDALVPLLRDPHWEVRVATLESLGRLHDQRVTEAVAECLRDSDREVREKAAECIGVLGDARAVAPLVDALVDPDRFVRQWARLALQRINPQWETSPEARARLEVLRSAATSGDFGVQYSAREALRALGDSPGNRGKERQSEGTDALRDLLAGFLADPDPCVRQAAVEALVRLPNVAPVIEPLRHDPDESVARAAARTPVLRPKTGRAESV